MFCVICIDFGVWVFNGYFEKCYVLYGGVLVKGWYSYEVGFCIVLYFIEIVVVKYGFVIELFFLLLVDYYMRVFVCVIRLLVMVKF